MVCSGLLGDGTGAYFTGGDIPGIPDCKERWVEWETRGGETVRGEVRDEGLTGSCNVMAHLTPR